MSETNEKVLFFSVVSVLALSMLAFMLFGIKKADANPSQILETKSAPATTTLSVMTIGTATTTSAVDTQLDGGQAYDSAALAVQFTASSTLSVLKIEFEYANSTFVNGYAVDCTATQTACDWYSDNLTATSTTANIVTSNTVMSWTNASSTTGGVMNTTQRTNKIFSVKTPTRYVRGVLSVSGANGMVWTDFAGKREQR